MHHSGLRLPRLTHTILVAFVASVTSLSAACGMSGPPRPVNAAGRTRNADDLLRYLPPRLLGQTVGRLPPQIQQTMDQRISLYSLSDWVTGFVGATVNAAEDENALGFVAVARTRGPDPARAPQIAYFGDEPGKIVRLTNETVAGEQVQSGELNNDNGRTEFLIWSPRADVVVALSRNSYGRHYDFDLSKAMEQLIAWSRK